MNCLPSPDIAFQQAWIHLLSSVLVKVGIFLDFVCCFFHHFYRELFYVYLSMTKHFKVFEESLNYSVAFILYCKYNNYI